MSLRCWKKRQRAWRLASPKPEARSPESWAQAHFGASPYQPPFALPWVGLVVTAQLPTPSASRA